MERLLKLGEVCHATGLGKTRVYQMIAEGSFPPPVKVGSRASRWPASWVQQWIEDRIREGNR